MTMTEYIEAVQALDRMAHAVLDWGIVLHDAGNLDAWYRVVHAVGDLLATQKTLHQTDVRLN